MRVYVDNQLFNDDLNFCRAARRRNQFRQHFIYTQTEQFTVIFRVLWYHRRRCENILRGIEFAHGVRKKKTRWPPENNRLLITAVTNGSVGITK